MFDRNGELQKKEEKSIGTLFYDTHLQFWYWTFALDFNSKRYYRRKKARKEKEQLIRELTQNNKDLNNFSYNIPTSEHHYQILLDFKPTRRYHNWESRIKEILNGLLSLPIY
jgi:hypothetical protein